MGALLTFATSSKNCCHTKSNTRGPAACWQGCAMSIANTTPICSQLPICEAAAQQQSQSMPQHPLLPATTTLAQKKATPKYFQQWPVKIHAYKCICECMYVCIGIYIAYTQHSAQTHLASVSRPGQHVPRNRTSQKTKKTSVKKGVSCL